MAFEDMDNETGDIGSEPPFSPEPANNRTFLVVAGVLGGIMLLALIVLALYSLILAPQRRNQQATQIAQVNFQNTEIALVAELTSQAAEATASLAPSRVTPGLTASPIQETERVTQAAPSVTAAESKPEDREATQDAGTATANQVTQSAGGATQEPGAVPVEGTTQPAGEATPAVRTATAAQSTQAAGVTPVGGTTQPAGEATPAVRTATAVLRTPVPGTPADIQSTQVAGGDGTPDPRTATVSALLTQSAGGGTQAPGTATAIQRTAAAGGATQDPRTATVSALLTRSAGGAGTATPTATALPTTGLAEEVGLPGLFGLTLVLLAVIFAARHLRAAANQ